MPSPHPFQSTKSTTAPTLNLFSSSHKIQPRISPSPCLPLPLNRPYTPLYQPPSPTSPPSTRHHLPPFPSTSPTCELHPRQAPRPPHPLLLRHHPTQQGSAARRREGVRFAPTAHYLTFHVFSIITPTHVGEPGDGQRCLGRLASLQLMGHPARKRRRGGQMISVNRWERRRR